MASCLQHPECSSITHYDCYYSTLEYLSILTYIDFRHFDPAIIGYSTINDVCHESNVKFYRKEL